VIQFDPVKAVQQVGRITHFSRFGFPLDRVGRQATMLAVLGVLSVDEAAAAVGLTAADLVREAEAWLVASQLVVDGS
jgi:hypothetical protein